MPEKHSFITPEKPLTDEIDQAGGSAACVDRIEQDTFGAGKELYSFYLCRLRAPYPAWQ
jgi:hypothetical protein